MKQYTTEESKTATFGTLFIYKNKTVEFQERGNLCGNNGSVVCSMRGKCIFIKD